MDTYIKGNVAKDQITGHGTLYAESTAIPFTEVVHEGCQCIS